MEQLESRNRILEAENEILKSENGRLKQSVSDMRLTVSSLNNESIGLYTTLPDKQTFDLVVNMVSRFPIKYHANWNVKIIPIEDQLLLTLMKLRLNTPNLDLAVRFNVSTSTVTNIFLTMIEVLHRVLYKGMMHGKLPSLAKNQMSAPESFKPFTNCRVVLDCTEVRTAKPQDLGQNCQTFSHYKKANTLKALVGTAPNGTITFASELYGGSTSDKSNH